MNTSTRLLFIKKFTCTKDYVSKESSALSDIYRKENWTLQILTRKAENSSVFSQRARVSELRLNYVYVFGRLLALDDEIVWEE